VLPLCYHFGDKAWMVCMYVCMYLLLATRPGFACDTKLFISYIMHVLYIPSSWSLNNFGKTWASGKNIRDASATPSGIKREYVCMYKKSLTRNFCSVKHQILPHWLTLTYISPKRGTRRTKRLPILYNLFLTRIKIYRRKTLSENRSYRHKDMIGSTLTPSWGD
jgi:hypothetical protein